MLAVQSKSSAAGSSTSRPLPLGNGEFVHSGKFPSLRLSVASLLACDTAKVLEASAGNEPLNRKPPEPGVKSDDPFIEERRP